MSEYQLSLVATRDSSLQGTGGCTSPRPSNFLFQSLTDLCALLQSKNDKGEKEHDTTTTATQTLFTYSIAVNSNLQFQNSISSQTLAKNKVHSTKIQVGVSFIHLYTHIRKWETAAEKSENRARTLEGRAQSVGSLRAVRECLVNCYESASNVWAACGCCNSGSNGSQGV